MTNPFQNHQQEIQQIIDEYGITYLALFGSRARGDQTNNSDFDILYDYEKPMTLSDASRLQKSLQNILKTEVDIISKKYLKPRFKKYIENDLVKIYER